MILSAVLTWVCVTLSTFVALLLLGVIIAPFLMVDKPPKRDAHC